MCNNLRHKTLNALSSDSLWMMKIHSPGKKRAFLSSSKSTVYAPTAEINQNRLLDKLGLNQNILKIYSH